MIDLKVNFENLTEEEKETIMKIIEKSNKTSKAWKPKNGDQCWYVNACGNVVDFNWDKNRHEISIYSIGNCFRTKEEAKNAVERLKIRAELQRYADEHNDEIDWTLSPYKWYIIYNHIDKKVEIYGVFFSQTPFEIYFSSREIARNAIRAVGEDRIKKYLFGVEVEE